MGEMLPSLIWEQVDIPKMGLGSSSSQVILPEIAVPDDRCHLWPLNTKKKATNTMEVKNTKKWELFMCPTPWEGWVQLRWAWDLLYFYEELSRVQAMSVKHLQEELTII
jgi:hypothetical protein